MSFLQRLCEDLEYSELIDKACTLSTSQERMAYVAAFTLSSYAETTTRTGKPFNPILGETYELDVRDWKGWRCVTEQVISKLYDLVVLLLWKERITLVLF